MSLKIKIFIFFVTAVTNCFGWGFFAHKQINKHAVFLLPNNSLFTFFKSHIHFITDNAVNADKRRYVVETEACRHYIDLDIYFSKTDSIPKYFQKAEEIFGTDTLNKHGILPWHIYKTKAMLTKAMLNRDVENILKLAADLGHYIGDSHVPLHTTYNYDGQYTNQKGIHGLWETRIPEILFENYDLWIGKAEYLTDVQEHVWNSVYNTHKSVDSVLKFEQKLTLLYPEDQKFSIEEKNGTQVKVYSKEYTQAYSQLLNGQVERQLRKSIKMTADIWYTCWIDAGQPNLHLLSLEARLDNSLTNNDVNGSSEETQNCVHNQPKGNQHKNLNNK